MSGKNLNRVGEEKYLKAKEKGCQLISYISNRSDCDTDDIGDNVFILPHTSIQPFAKIGNNVVMCPETALGHHVEIKDNCFLASPKISGFCKIEKNIFWEQIVLLQTILLLENIL